MSTRRTRRTEAQPAPVLRSRQPTDHLLDLLTYSGWPLTVGELREHGISAPAQTIYELQLAGYEIDRVPVRHDGRCASGYRLHPPTLDDPGRADSAPSRERPPSWATKGTVPATRRRSSRTLASGN